MAKVAQPSHTYSPYQQFLKTYIRGDTFNGWREGRERTKSALWGWRLDLLREKTLLRVSPLLFLNEQHFGTREEAW